VLSAIDEDSSCVPRLLTDYILKGESLICSMYYLCVCFASQENIENINKLVTVIHAFSMSTLLVGLQAGHPNTCETYLLILLCFNAVCGVIGRASTL